MAKTPTETPAKGGFGLTVIIGIGLACTAVAVFAAAIANHKDPIHVVNNAETNDNNTSEPPPEDEMVTEVREALKDYAQQFQSIEDPTEPAEFSRVMRSNLDTLRDLQSRWGAMGTAAVAQMLETMFGTFFDQRTNSPRVQRHVSFRLIAAFWWIASAQAEGSGLKPVQRLDRGRLLVREALALAPRNAWAFFLRGMATKQDYQMQRAATQQGNPQLLAQARDDFVKATELDASLFEAWFQAGATALTMGQLEQAAQCAWRAVELAPDDQQNWELAITAVFEQFEQVPAFSLLQGVLDAVEAPGLNCPKMIKVVVWAMVIEKAQALMQSDRRLDFESMIEQMYGLGQKALSTARDPELWEKLPANTKIMLMTFAAQAAVALDDDIDGALALYREALAIDPGFYSACYSLTGAAFETMDARLARAAIEAWIGFVRAHGAATLQAREEKLEREIILLFKPTQFAGMAPICLTRVEGVELPLDELAWLLRELLTLRDHTETIDDAICHVLPVVLGMIDGATTLSAEADQRVAASAAFYRSVFQLARGRMQVQRASIRRPSARAATVLALALFRADPQSQAERTEIKDLLADGRAALNRKTNALATTPMSTICDTLIVLIEADDAASGAGNARPLNDDERAGLIDGAFTCLARVRDLPTGNCYDLAPQVHRLLNALVDEPLKPDWSPGRLTAGADTQTLIDEWKRKLGR